MHMNQNKAAPKSFATRGKPRLRSAPIAMALAAAALAHGLPAQAAEADLLKKLEAMEREIEALKAQMKAQAQAPAAMPAAAASGGPQVTLGGQYRINAYSVDNDVPGEDRQTASRVRIRQNIDLRFDSQFKSHLQLELGHTTDNVTTTANSNRRTNVNVRHAVLDYTTNGGINLQGGIVPLSDYFGDTLFSADWNYNPVALSAVMPIGAGKLRAFAGTLNETIAPGGETNSKDDTTHYQVDYVMPLGDDSQLNVGVGYVNLTPDAGPTFRSKHGINYGVGGKFGIGAGLMLNAMVVGSETAREIHDPTGARGTGKGRGVAAKLELTGKAGPGAFGLLATHASGKSGSNGFIPIMALSKTNGYWGYTGILTIQGPTDTGIDGDSVNISNNGYGMSTLQAKYAFPITADLSGYIGLGWFGNAKTPTGRSDDVGTDLILMGTYRFNKLLALDFGAVAARLKDGLSGYSNGIIGGAPFNQAAGESRTKVGGFTRLQAEF